MAAIQTPVSVPPPFTGSIIAGAYVQGQSGVGTSATLGNNNCRVLPFYSPVPFHISAIGAEFTAAGDAGSIFVPGVWADNGSGYPGALLSAPGSISTGTGNAGTVATGGTPGVYMVPLAANQQIPAGLSWWGGAIQDVSATQPTMRTGEFNAGFGSAGNAVPGAGAVQIGYTTPASGALPNPFTAFPASAASSGPRIVFLVASVP